MKISVITPVKNGEKYLSETIESVLNQKGNFDLEYFIMDGGSTDDTLKICSDYEQQFNDSSRKIFCRSIEFDVLSKADGSMYEALAKGLRLATGDIVCYINADDFFLPNAFSCVHEIFSNYPDLKWIKGLPMRYNEQGHIINSHFPWQYNSNLILKGFHGKTLPFIQQESTFWRSDLNTYIDLNQLRNYKLAGDFFIWHSFAGKDAQLYIVDTFLAGNRLRDGQLSEKRESYFKEFDSIKSRSNPFDNVRVLFYRMMEKYAGKPVKRRLSNNRISYKKGRWELKS